MYPVSCTAEASILVFFMCCLQIAYPLSFHKPIWRWLVCTWWNNLDPGLCVLLFLRTILVCSPDDCFGSEIHVNTLMQNRMGKYKSCLFIEESWDPVLNQSLLEQWETCHQQMYSRTVRTRATRQGFPSGNTTVNSGSSCREHPKLFHVSCAGSLSSTGGTILSRCCWPNVQGSVY